MGKAGNRLNVGRDARGGNNCRSGSRDGYTPMTGKPYIVANHVLLPHCVEGG
jgi:hypothetical protein